MAFEVLMNEIRGLGLDIRLHRPEDMSFDSAPATLDFGTSGKASDQAPLDIEFVPKSEPADKGAKDDE